MQACEKDNLCGDVLFLKLFIHFLLNDDNIW